MEKKYGCVMLAGGGGSRMGGVNKAKLRYNGATFASRICGELEKTGMPCFISAARYDQAVPEGWSVISDDVTDADGEYIGPMGGICTCLRKACDEGLDGLFFAPCDVPYYDSSAVEKLLPYIEDGCDAVMWRTADGRQQTAFGWYSVSCLPMMEEDISNGKYKLLKLLDKLNVKIVDTAEAGADDKIFLNINDRESYRKILSAKGDKYAESLGLEDAVSLLQLHTVPVAETEEVSVMDCCGRTLAEDITALHDQPPFPRSPLDGYAVMAEDTAGASEDKPVCLRVITEVDAGMFFEGTVGPGEAVRIMTGGPIPEGADAIVGQEDTDYGEDVVSIYYEFKPYQNYCFQGEDYSKGTILLRAHENIGPAEAGIIASTGRASVRVYRKPRVLLISTGDEVIAPGEDLGHGKIFDSNLYTLSAQLKQWDVEIAEALHSGDDAEHLAKLIESKIDDADIVITCGGVSVGKKDILHEVYRLLDVDRLLRNIRIKPGMAMLAGTYRDKMILSLSGNPYAAYTGLHMAVRPVIATLKGSGTPYTWRMKAVLMDDYSKKSPTRRFIRAVVTDGKAYIEGHTGGNGDVYSGHETNALVEIPSGSDKLRAGDTVDVVLL